MPPGLHFPRGAEWFGHHDDAVTTHSHLIELAGGEARVATAREPLQSRQVVRDRVSRIAEDCRRSHQPTTVVFCAPGAAWRASPAGLRRELRAVADEVAIVLIARRPESAAASMLADAVRRADETGQLSLSARSALADPALRDEHDYAALRDRWTDPTGVVPLILVPYPEHPRGGATLLTRVAERAELTHLGTTDATSVGSPSVALPHLAFPSLSREDLAELIRLRRRRNRLGWVPTVGRRLDAQFGEARRAAEERAMGGGDPFRFSEAERRWIERRHRNSLKVLRHTLGADADDPEWRAWFATE